MTRVRIGIAGLGVIGKAVAKAVAAGIPPTELAAVSSGNASRALQWLGEHGINVPVVGPEDLAERCDVVVECAPTAAFESIVEPALRRARIVVTVSSAALITHMELVDLARRTGGRIVLATGALLSLDAVRAAALGTIYSVTMVTRKPPRSLVGAPYLEARGIDVLSLKTPLMVFEGSAREGAAGFPANVNVAASLALAGVGPDLTKLQIWADPTKELNTHTIEVIADSVRFQSTIENVPSFEKPGTGKVTALSVIAALRSLFDPLRVGT